MTGPIGGASSGAPVPLDVPSALGGHFHLRRGDDVDPTALLVELDRPLDQRIDRPVAADPDVLARVPLRALLPADDAARLGQLAAEQLDPQHLRVRVAAVAAGALPLLVSHRYAVLRVR